MKTEFLVQMQIELAETIDGATGEIYADKTSS